MNTVANNVAPQHKEFRAFVCDSDNGPVIRTSGNANAHFDIAKVLAGYKIPMDVANDMAAQVLRVKGLDSAEPRANAYANSKPIQGAQGVKGIDGSTEGLQKLASELGLHALAADSGDIDMKALLEEVKTVLGRVSKLAESRTSATGQELEGGVGDVEAAWNSPVDTGMAPGAETTGEMYDEQGNNIENTAPNMNGGNRAAMRGMDARSTNRAHEQAEHTADMLRGMGDTDGAIRVMQNYHRDSQMQRGQAAQDAFSAGYNAAQGNDTASAATARMLAAMGSPDAKAVAWEKEQAANLAARFERQERLKSHTGNTAKTAGR